jgi:DME family drug/metabolite transporter
MQTTIMAPRAEARVGLLLVMFSAMMWGTVGVTTKALYGLAATNPLSIGFFRLALAVPALFLGCGLLLGRRTFQVTRRDLIVMMLIGAVTALYQVCYFGAIARVGVAVAVLITLCTAPVIVAVLSAFLTKERLTGRVLLALGCALAGTAMLIEIQPGSGIQGSVLFSGVLLALGSAFGYAVIAIASRALAGRYHPLQPIAIGFSFGAVVLLVFALPTGLVMDYPPLGWSLLLYLGLAPTALAYGLFLAGMRTTPATVASIATLLKPLTSTVLAWLLFGERFSRLGLVGVVLLGLAMVVLYGNRES